MWFNEYKRRVTNDGEIPLTPIMGLFGGMSAGCFSTLGNNPFDVVKASIGFVVFCWFGAIFSRDYKVLMPNQLFSHVFRSSSPHISSNQ